MINMRISCKSWKSNERVRTLNELQKIEHAHGMAFRAEQMIIATDTHSGKSKSDTSLVNHWPKACRMKIVNRDPKMTYPQTMMACV